MVRAVSTDDAENDEKVANTVSYELSNNAVKIEATDFLELFINYQEVNIVLLFLLMEMLIKSLQQIKNQK